MRVSHTICAFLLAASAPVLGADAIYFPATKVSEAFAKGEVVCLDPALDDIVPSTARVEKLASRFLITEGPLWVRDGGYLLFSDPNHNRI